MCAVSFVSEHYFQKYTKPYDWTWPTWSEYQELKRKAELYDKMTGQADCIKPEFIKKEQAVELYFKTQALS